jgi:hypothetical protein
VDLDGNVGAGLVVRDRSGANVRNVRNPRPAAGWAAREGSTSASLAELSTSVPASIRTQDRITVPADAETVAVAFRTAAGSQVAARALAVEEGLGPKTVSLVCTGPGGVAPSAADLAELDAYINGRTVGLQRVGGLVLHNYRITPVAVTLIPVDVDVTVQVLADYAAEAEALIAASLSSYLQPTARNLIRLSDGTITEGDGWQWQHGGTVARANLLGRVVTATPGVVNTTLTTPATDVTLSGVQLPTVGTISITIVSV